MIENRWLKTALISGLAILVVGGVTRSLIFKAERRAAFQAKQIAGLTVVAHEKFLWSLAEASLEHLISMPEVKRMESNACEKFVVDWNQEMFAVIALGDKEGETVCVADSEAEKPLPTMKDRLYFERVRDAEGLVMGEYAVSRTTGKQVLHFAYPIREDGEFKGLIMAGLDLSWLTNEVISEAFESEEVELMLLDRKGRILAAYPPETNGTGESGLNFQLLNFYLSANNDYKVLRGKDGVKRVYEYEFLGEEEEVVLFVGVRILDYYMLLILVALPVAVLTSSGWVLRDYWKKKIK